MKIIQSMGWFDLMDITRPFFSLHGYYCMGINIENML